MAVRPLEKVIQAEVKKVLALHGYLISDFSQGYRPGGSRHASTRITCGVPDVYVQHRSLPITMWIEVKRPGENLSADQVAWHAAEKHAGGKVIVIHSGHEMHLYLEQFHAIYNPSRYPVPKVSAS